MKIEHLCYLREIAKCRSISSAAKRLYIGQTTLSAIIKSLEEELGVQIFLRTSSGVQLTKEGERVLELSEDMIGSYNEMLHGFQRGASPEKRVHFLCDTTMSRYFSVQLIKAIQLCNREASIVFHEVERQRLLTSLLDGIANIGVTSMDMSVEIEGMQLQAERNGVEVTLLGVDKFYLCVRADHPRYAHRTSVDVNELMDERYIAPQHYSTVSNGTVFSSAFRKLNCVATHPDPDIVLEAVRECDMITILSGRSLVADQNILYGNLVAIPLTGFPVPNRTGIYLFSKPRRSLNYFEKVLYDTMREHGKRLTELTGCDDELYPTINQALRT